MSCLDSSFGAGFVGIPAHWVLAGKPKIPLDRETVWQPQVLQLAKSNGAEFGTLHAEVT